MAYGTPEVLELGTRQRVMVMPTDIQAIAAINSAMLDLTHPEFWRKVGAIEPQACADWFFDWYMAWHDTDAEIEP